MLGTILDATVIKKKRKTKSLVAYILVIVEGKKVRELSHVLEIDMCYWQKELGGQMVTFETLENHKFPI